MYVLRSGCQWNALPREHLGSASAERKRFLEWVTAGVFDAIWKAGLAEYVPVEGIAWRWRSIDGAMFKALMAQEAVGRNPIDRGKNGSKAHLLVDGRGIPLPLVVTGANAHVVMQLDKVHTANTGIPACLRCQGTGAWQTPGGLMYRRHLGLGGAPPVCAAYSASRQLAGVSPPHPAPAWPDFPAPGTCASTSRTCRRQVPRRI